MSDLYEVIAEKDRIIGRLEGIVEELMVELAKFTPTGKVYMSHPYGQLDVKWRDATPTTGTLVYVRQEN